jgi:uncharacterized protein YllA (UPF0747 family)
MSFTFRFLYLPWKEAKVPIRYHPMLETFQKFFTESTPSFQSVVNHSTDSHRSEWLRANAPDLFSESIWFKSLLRQS